MEFCPGCWVDTVWCLSGKSLNSPWKHRQGAGSLLGVSSCYVHTALKLPCVGVLQLSVWGEVGGIQVLGQPWFIPSESSVLSGLLGQLSKYHESSGKREFACTHVCTHTYAHTRNPPCHRLLIPLTAPTPPYVLSRLISLWPFSHHHIPLQGCVPHTLIRPTLSGTNKVIFFVFTFKFILHCSPQRHPNWEGKKAPATNLLLTTSKQWVHALYGGLLSGWGKRSLTECTPILNLHLLRLAFFLPIFVLQCFLQVEI